MPQVIVTLSDEWIAKLQAIANDQGATLEQVLRHCMEKGYDFCFGEIATQLKDGMKQIEEYRRSPQRIDLSAIRARAAELKAKHSSGDVKHDG